MDRSLAGQILFKIAVAILVIALVDLAFVNWWIIQSQKSPLRQGYEGQARTVSQELAPSPSSDFSSSPFPATEPEVETKTIETKTVVERETQTIVQTAQKEIFIPIGSGSTASGTYADLAGMEVTIDTSKYGAIESAAFEASIWVQDGNGKMYAQLYNSSDKHPVWNSEISTNSAKGVLTTSQNITLDKGAKTYQVQAKTNLTSYAAHVDNARLKIVLK